MAHHDHVVELRLRVDAVGERGIGRRGKHVRQARHLDDVRRVPAAGAFRVERVDRAALERGDRVLDEARLVQRVGVHAHLDVHVVGHRERRAEHGRRGAPVLVALEAHRAGLDLLDQRRLAVPVALREDADVDGPALERAQHVRDVARAGRHRRRVRSVRRPGAAADQRRRAVGQRRVRLLRRDEVDVRVDAGGRQDQMVARDRVGGEAALEARRDVVHRLRIAGLADRADPAVLDADVGLHHAQHRVDDRHVGDDEVGCAGMRAPVVHPHAFAQALAAAEDDLVAGRAAQVALDLDEETGVAQPDAVARRGAEQSDVLVARDLGHVQDPKESWSVRRSRAGVTASSGSRASRPVPRTSPSGRRRPCRRSGRRPDC